MSDFIEVFCLGRDPSRGKRIGCQTKKELCRYDSFVKNFFIKVFGGVWGNLFSKRFPTKKPQSRKANPTKSRKAN